MRTGTRWNNVGLPSEGNDHPDPITDLVGIHPIEAGIGAAFAGIFLALALGAVAGPTFAVLGAIVGVLAGTCIGDGVGEIIAPRLGLPLTLRSQGRIGPRWVGPNRNTTRTTSTRSGAMCGRHGTTPSRSVAASNGSRSWAPA